MNNNAWTRLFDDLVAVGYEVTDSTGYFANVNMALHTIQNKLGEAAKRIAKRKG